MFRARHRVEGLPELEDLIRQVLGPGPAPWPIDYVALVLRHRVGPSDTEEQIVRIDLSEEHYLFRDGLPESAADVAHAIVNALRSEIEGNLDPEQPTMQWRAKIYARSGYKCGRAITATLPATEGANPTPVTQQAVALMEDLDDATAAQRVAVAEDIHGNYRRLMETVFSGVERFVAITNGHMDQMNTNVQVQYRHAEAMTRASIEDRRNELDKRRGELQDKADATLKSQAMDKALSMGRDLLSGLLMEKGIDPAMADVLSVLQSHPRAASLLRNPKLKEALTNPEVMTILSDILEAAASETPNPSPSE